MRKPSIRSEFSSARFLNAAEYIAVRDGLIAISFASVARLCGVQQSSVQRQFPTTERLRAATLELWTDAFERAMTDRVEDGVRGIWDLIQRWFRVNARHPLPCDVLGSAAATVPSSGLIPFQQVVRARHERWLDRALRHAATIPPDQWRPDVDPSRTVRGLCAAAMGAVAARGVLGETAATEALASVCWRTLHGSVAPASNPLVATDISKLAEACARLSRSRPDLEWIADESRSSAFAREHRGEEDQRGAKASTTQAPSTWDDVLASAAADLDDYQRRNPQDDEEDFYEPSGP